MTNFVCPSFFERFRLKARKTVRYDYLDKLKKPFSLRPTGYTEYRSARRAETRWGSPAKKSKFAKEDRRYHRSEFRKAIASNDPALYQKVCRTGLA